jgi:hypothetical protein
MTVEEVGYWRRRYWRHGYAVPYAYYPPAYGYSPPPPAYAYYPPAPPPENGDYADYLPPSGDYGEYPPESDYRDYPPENGY